MNKYGPTLYATVERKQPESDVRHLLIFYVDGSRETRLIQLNNGIEMLIATGTEYETKQKANELLKLWITEGNFISPKDGYAYESLERTIALAMKMGYKTIYDDRYKKDRPPNMNLIGNTPLKTWIGMTANNGGGYVYALDQMRLHACPTLPPSSKSLVAPTGGAEFATFMLKQIAIRDAVGPIREFILSEN